MTGKKIYLPILLIIVLGLGILPSYSEDFVSFKGRINADEINIRSDSTVASEVVITLTKGDGVEVVGELYDWYKVRLPKLSPAYVFKDLTESLDEKAAVVLKDNVNIRLGPSEKSAILGRMNKDEVLTVLETDGDWLKIKPPSDSFGWVNKMFVTRSLASEKTKLKAKKAPPVLVKDEVFLEGVVRPYGKVMSRPATHKLVTGDYKTYLLSGDLVALNALNYRKVRVVGKIIEENKQ
ncbi:MAG: SH3 domain-containing protein, partial [Candidatus Omnitrophica bacterium]|nr:SH3 domain-containing protein [Candidatus Omnitrophota bacterium]